MALVTAVGVSACDRQPTVVTVPAPLHRTGAGQTGGTGNTGDTGQTGDTGKTGDGTTVIVQPATPPPSN